MEHDEAVKLLFEYYISEQFYEEQWGTAEDLIQDLLEYARGGVAHVRATVERLLDFDLTCDYPATAKTETEVRTRMRVKLNGHEKTESIVEAAVVVWRNLKEER